MDVGGLFTLSGAVGFGVGEVFRSIDPNVDRVLIFPVYDIVLELVFGDGVLIGFDVFDSVAVEVEAEQSQGED